MFSAVFRHWQGCRGVSLSTVVHQTVQLHSHSANCHLQPRGESWQAALSSARAPPSELMEPNVEMHYQIKTALTSWTHRSGRLDRARPRAWIQQSPSDHPVWSMRPPLVILTVLPSSAWPGVYVAVQWVTFNLFLKSVDGRTRWICVLDLVGRAGLKSSVKEYQKYKIWSFGKACARPSSSPSPTPPLPTLQARVYPGCSRAERERGEALWKVFSSLLPLSISLSLCLSPSSSPSLS